jgi:hypothetical protein
MVVDYESPACRGFSAPPVRQLLDATGAVAATAWGAGAALASSFLFVAAAADAAGGCTCEAGPRPPPYPPSPPHVPSPPPPLSQPLPPATFTTIATTDKYSRAAAVGDAVYFAPANQNNVGVLNTTTNVFTTIATTGDAASGDGKYTGAAAVGDKVIFAPSAKNNVGLLDTTTNVFTTIATTGAAISGCGDMACGAGSKYSGAAAVGDVVYFAPSSQNNVGVLDTTP